MALKGFGINADANRLDGDLSFLRRDLMYFQEIGYDYVEIPVHGVEAIRNGQIVVQQVQETAALLKEFPFRYTVQAPSSLNLMNLRELNMRKKMFLGSIQFAHAIGSNILVYHCGRYIPEEEFLFNRKTNYVTFEMMEGLRLVEIEAIQEFADYARDLGIEICLENACPYLDGSPYSYGEFLDHLIDQVQRIDKNNIGINLDIGHAYLASSFYNFDFLEAIKLVKPLVRHMHVHDNFGKPSALYESTQSELIATGRGDCHMPIGWGQIPIDKVIKILKEYEGVFMQELQPRYYRYCKETLAHAKDIAVKAGWLNSPAERLTLV